MDARFTIADLAGALFNAEKFKDAHIDREKYHSNRYQAMARAFGVTQVWSNGRFEDGGVSETETFAALDLAASCVRSLVRLSYSSPFSGYLEAPENIIELHKEFDKTIRDGISQAEAGVMNLLVATLPLALDIPSDRRVSFEDLLENGLDTSLHYPDEYDYF